MVFQVIPPETPSGNTFLTPQKHVFRKRVTKSPKNLFLSRRISPQNPQKPPKNTRKGDRLGPLLVQGWKNTGFSLKNPQKPPKNPQKPQKTPILRGGSKTPKNPIFGGFWGGRRGGHFGVFFRSPVTVREPPCPRSETNKEKK